LSFATIKTACKAKKLRSLSIFKPEKFEINNFKEFVLDVVSNMTHLCSLNLYKIGIENIRSAIGKLKHLRFADLPYVNITKLSNSISRLYNLHTLTLKHCPNLVKFPDGIGNMVSLRHLDIR